jgi:hypothetical protein
VRASTFLGFALVCGGLAGCGAGAKGHGPDSRNKLPDALSCIKQDKGLPARQAGADAIQVGDPARGPLIRFFLTGGEAEAVQFEGREEGSEQIGASLLYVRQANDHTLQDVETCLDDL